ncbi:uncharacterized protein LY79DRAFT_66080 [Colletotrichum navitas]|uniref:Uncharacterized protein n=1 Tax=Colletotrichum navitas TaxID=681940 RepID=A0AAD8PLH4_9PEZI|nr:uncharacterized protein LY79DRAFT_66080 [Colletotrichum navitas]KAK1569885.1 hypothetical protein LY79DRAFT_66080 [Colletotrichum navitas]
MRRHNAQRIHPLSSSPGRAVASKIDKKSWSLVLGSVGVRLGTGGGFGRGKRRRAPTSNFSSSSSFSMGRVEPRIGNRIGIVKLSDAAGSSSGPWVVRRRTGVRVWSPDANDRGGSLSPHTALLSELLGQEENGLTKRQSLGGEGGGDDVVVMYCSAKGSRYRFTH